MHSKVCATDYKDKLVIVPCPKTDEDADSLIERINALIAASAGMTTEEAVKHITHGREMRSILERWYYRDKISAPQVGKLIDLLNKEGA